MSWDGKGRDGTGVGIAGVGAALPGGRLEVADVTAGWDQGKAKGTLAVCGPDEDTLTLAWAAGVRALEVAGLSAGDVGGLWWGTARPPMAEGPSHSFLSTAIGLSHNAGGLLAGGSNLAGLDALVAASEAVASGSVETALVVASDALKPGPRTGAERETGAGAIALVLKAGTGPAIVAEVARHSVALLDRYRGDGQDGTGDPYDPRLYREKELIPYVKNAVAGLRNVPGDAGWSVPDPDGRLGKVVAKTIGAGKVLSEGLQGRIGDTGSAAVLLGALGGLSEAGCVIVVGTGGGRTTAIRIEVSGPVPGATASVEDGLHGKAMSYTSVLRARGQLVPLAEPVAMGVPPGSAAFVRGSEELLKLEGRKCPSCATIAVPPSIHPVCPTCGTEGGEIVGLARRGRVQTFVINHTMPPPFEAPLPMVVVDLEDGARVLLQGMPEDAGVLEIGDPVELELRRYAVERGVPVYGFKVRLAAPVAVSV